MRRLSTAALTALSTTTRDIVFPPRRIRFVRGHWFGSSFQCFVSRKEGINQRLPLVLGCTFPRFSFPSTCAANKSFRDWPVWMTSAYKGQTRAAALASFRRGELDSWLVRVKTAATRAAVWRKDGARCSFCLCGWAAVRCVLFTQARLRSLWL